MEYVSIDLQEAKILQYLENKKPFIEVIDKKK